MGKNGWATERRTAGGAGGQRGKDIRMRWRSDGQRAFHAGVGTPRQSPPVSTMSICLKKWLSKVD